MSGEVDWAEALESRDSEVLMEHVTFLCAHLGPDELRVVTCVALALRRGRSVYGELDIASDERDFDDEADQERTDMLVYCAIAALRKGGLL